MDGNAEEVYRVAQLYYVHDETMESIAKRLGVSRSTVSRLLKQARASGIVRITLAQEASASRALVDAFSEVFGVRAHVVAMRESIGDFRRLDAVARFSANLLDDLVSEGTTIGVAWGTTLSAVTTHLRFRPTPGVRLVQLNGAANPSTSGIPYAGEIMSRMAESYGGELTYFPVPAFFDYPATREAMWRERSIERVLDLQRQCDLAVFGVGSLRGTMTSHVYTGGYLDREDMEALARSGVVGDVCTVMLREDGTWADIEVNQRASGPNPEELARIPRRLCIVAGEAKVAATLGALRAGTITDLVIDEPTALRVMDQGGRRRREWQA
ncbi:MAG: sugar-binding transcriptional regulator [bacterium]|nr:sugar-binding transcriptional regulator [bacterium]